MLSLDRLRVLRAVGTHGSVQAAADALYVSPSAVSQQIAKLEREVGQHLLERNGRGVRLTPAAELLTARTTEVLTLLEAIEGDLDDLRDVVAGPVRISAFPTAARGIGPLLLRDLIDRHPGLEPSLSEHEPTESLPLLARGDIDVVIAQDWFNAPLALPTGLHRVALFDDVVDIALPCSHRLAKRRTVRLEELANDGWITWPAQSICHDWLVHTLRSKGHEPQIRHTAGEHATQLALVSAGLGFAVMPRLGRDHIPDGVAIVAVEPTLHRHLFAAWRANAAHRSNIEAVRVSLLHVAATMSRSRRSPARRRTAVVAG